MIARRPPARLSPAQLRELTGKVRPSAQRAWFQRHYAVTLPADPLGPIITSEAFEAMIAARCGIKPDAPVRPTVIMRKSNEKSS